MAENTDPTIFPSARNRAQATAMFNIIPCRKEKLKNRAKYSGGYFLFSIIQSVRLELKRTVRSSLHAMQTHPVPQLLKGPVVKNNSIPARIAKRATTILGTGLNA